MRKICFIVSAAIRIAILRRLAAQHGLRFYFYEAKGLAHQRHNGGSEKIVCLP
jgi:hypothetical protein